MILDLTQQGHLVDLVQREVKLLLQSALDVALSVVRANPTVLEGLGAHLEGTKLLLSYFLNYVSVHLYGTIILSRIYLGLFNWMGRQITSKVAWTGEFNLPSCLEMHQN